MKKLFLLLFVFLVLPLAHAITVTHTGSFTAGETLNISIDMEDTGYVGNVFWNTTTDSELTWSLINGSGTFNAVGMNYSFDVNDSGSFILSLSSNVAETFDLTVENGSETNITTIVVNPDTATAFFVEHEGEGVAGEDVAINLLAKDQYGNVADYNGYALLTTTAEDFNTVTWSEGSAWNGPGVWKYDFDGDGNVTIQLNNTKAESITITADNAFLVGDTSTALVISAAGMDHFAVTHDGYGTVGSTKTVTVTAQDEYNNTVLDYVGDYTITTTASYADNLTWNPTAPYVFTGSENGVDDMDVSSSVAQSFTITAENIDGNTGTSETLTFDSPEISVEPSSGDIGDEITVTGTGFGPEVNVDVKLDGTTVNPTTTDADGALSATFAVPQIANGTYNITAETANVEFTVNPTYVGFEADEPSTALIVNPVAGSTGTITFVVSALGNMPINITGVTSTELTNEGTYTISNVSFSPSSVEFGWDETATITTTVVLDGEPVEGTYTGTITLTDGTNDVEVPLSVELTTGVYGLAVADTLSISGNDEETTKTAVLTLTNNGTLDLSGLSLTYASSDLSNGKVSFSAVDALTAGASQSVTVTANITDLSIGTYSGIITVSTAEGIDDTVAVTITVTEAPLELLVIDEVDINGEDETTESDITLDRFPEDLEIIVNVENKADFNMEDIEVEITITDIDDQGDDDLEDDLDMDDIGDGDDEDFTFNFNNIDWDYDDTSYKVIIEVTGENEDDSSDSYSDTWEFDLKIDRDDNDIAITEAYLDSSTLQCSRNTYLNIELTNIGEDDQDYIVFLVENEDLGISHLNKQIELDDTDSETKKIAINLADSVSAGTYSLYIYTYYDWDEYSDEHITDFEAVDLVVEDCVTTTPTTPTTTPTTPAPTTPTGAVAADIPTSSEGFSDSVGYAVMLVLANLVLLVIIIFVLVKIFTPRTRLR